MELEWKENTGKVPEEVTKATMVEVIYRSGSQLKWRPHYSPIQNDDPELWIIEGVQADVMFYRVIWE